MPLSYDRAVAALRGGDRLMITHPTADRPAEKPVYGLVRSGKSVGVATYRKLVGNLAPATDGLFGAEISQTFVWVEDNREVGR